MSKVEAAWSKVREGNRRIQLLSTQGGGSVGSLAHALDDGVSTDELAAVARNATVRFRALSLACELAATGGDELVEANPFRMSRKQAFNMGAASSQRNQMMFFHGMSVDFIKLAEHFGCTTLGTVEEEARKKANSVVEHRRSVSGW
jgi:hypothetical protein